MLPGLKPSERQKLTLSKETITGLKITCKLHRTMSFNGFVIIIYLLLAKSFCELGPQLLELPGVKYVLSEVFFPGSSRALLFEATALWRKQ